MKFLHTKKGKIVMNFVYGMGAAVVIVGAMFKIMHWPGANEMLIVGLSTEAVIFAISAFDPPSEDLDWTLVYPELAGLPGEDGQSRGGVAIKDSLTQELDKMLAEAKIGPELLESLGSSIKRLGDNTNQLADISFASVATDEYVQSVNTASKTVSQLSESYVKAAESLTIISVSNQDGQSYGEQLQRVSKN